MYIFTINFSIIRITAFIILQLFNVQSSLRSKPPKKSEEECFRMTERASRTKTFIIAEEQHVNIDYIYSVTSFFRQERREISGEK